MISFIHSIVDVEYQCTGGTSNPRIAETQVVDALAYKLLEVFDLTLQRYLIASLFERILQCFQHVSFPTENMPPDLGSTVKDRRNYIPVAPNSKVCALEKTKWSHQSSWLYRFRSRVNGADIYYTVDPSLWDLIGRYKTCGLERAGHSHIILIYRRPIKTAYYTPNISPQNCLEIIRGTKAAKFIAPFKEPRLVLCPRSYTFMYVRRRLRRALGAAPGT